MPFSVEKGIFCILKRCEIAYSLKNEGSRNVIASFAVMFAEN